MDWKVGRDIGFVIASDEVLKGRPEPYMIRVAMRRLGIKDVSTVIKIGDTPVDLQEGHGVGCYTFGLTNGSHTREELKAFDSDQLFGLLTDFLDFLKTALCLEEKSQVIVDKASISSN